MSDFGHILGGALQGIGAGLLGQAQAKAESAKSAAAERFQLLMSDREHGQNLEAAERASAHRQAEATHGSTLKRGEMRLGATLDDDRAAKQTARSTASQITVDNARSANDRVMARLQSGLRMTEQQASAATELANQITLAGQTIHSSEIAADGSMVLTTKTGRQLRTQAGIFNPKNAPDEGIPGLPTATKPAAPAGNAPRTIKFDKEGNIVG